jgi:hypothetical protein
MWSVAMEAMGSGVEGDGERCGGRSWRIDRERQRGDQGGLEGGRWGAAMEGSRGSMASGQEGLDGEQLGEATRKKPWTIEKEDLGRGRRMP